MQREEPRRRLANAAPRSRSRNDADLVCEKHRCFPPLELVFA
jgi:hypothetical protein